jgi:hypothetical protein
MWRVARPQALLLLLTLLTFVQPASAFPQRGVPPGLCRLLEMVQVAFVRRAGNGRCIPTDPESALRALARNPVESVVRYLWRRPLHGCPAVVRLTRVRVSRPGDWGW